MGKLTSIPEKLAAESRDNLLYEQDMDLRLLVNLLQKLDRKVVFDVGAEQGKFVQAFLEGGASQIYAFEPYPPNKKVLEERFRSSPGVRLLELALGRQDEQATLHIAHDHQGQVIPYVHSLLGSPVSGANYREDTLPVEVRSLQSLAAADEIPTAIGILRIDTNGNDLAVLQGMGPLSSDVIVLEYWTDLLETVGKCPYKFSDIVSLLQPLGYSNFVFVNRWGEFQSAQMNSLDERPGMWGNVIFIHDRILDRGLPVILQVSNAAHETLLDAAQKYKDEADRRQAVIDELVQTNEQQAAFIKKLKSPHFWLRQFACRLRMLPQRFQARPRLGVLQQHKPILLHIPAHYIVPIHVAVQPIISIVTPSYNQGTFIERTIQSVLNQNYPDLEYIVQDSESTDETGQVLSRYRSKLTFVEVVKDKGQADAINRGFAHTTGEIMAYLNSDDVLLPGCLGYVADYFAKHPDIDVIYSHRVIIDEHDQEIGRWVLPAHSQEMLQWADFVPQETLFWRRRLWDRVGGCVDDSFQFAIDWELLIRFHKAGARFARVSRFLAAFRVHIQQKTSAHMQDLGLPEVVRVLECCHERPVSNVEIKQHLRSYMRQHIWYDRFYRWGLLRF